MCDGFQAKRRDGMRAAVFSAKNYEKRWLNEVNQSYGHELAYFDLRLQPSTAPLAAGFDAVSIFVNDEVNREVIKQLAGYGVRIIATRSAGYNQIDLGAAAEHGICVARVPAYSPSAVSEFTIGLILALGRNIHRAYNRVRDRNFELDGLQGFELRGKTIGVFGTGKIGAHVIRNLSGFGVHILAYDPYRNPEVAALVEYVDTPQELARAADIITLHLPLTPQSHHLINAELLAEMKDGVFIVNTSRGGLIDTAAVVEALKAHKVGFLAIDVYEEEESLFFADRSGEVLEDDIFARLLTFPNVLVTGHQAFLTDVALRNIAETTLTNLTQLAQTGRCDNAVQAG
jgi:D-lactate dehydrogenase